MTTTVALTTLVTLAVGLFLPTLAALVTRETLPEWGKQAVLLFLSTATGVLSSIVGAVPTTVSGWVAVLLNIGVTYVAALATQVNTWEKTQTTARIHRATDRLIGLGKKPAAGLPQAA